MRNLRRFCIDGELTEHLDLSPELRFGFRAKAHLGGRWIELERESQSINKTVDQKNVLTTPDADVDPDSPVLLKAELLAVIKESERFAPSMLSRVLCGGLELCASCADSGLAAKSSTQLVCDSVSREGPASTSTDCSEADAEPLSERTSELASPSRTSSMLDVIEDSEEGTGGDGGRGRG